MPDRLMLDTSVLVEHMKGQSRREVVEELLKLQRQGVVDLAVTARVREDVPRDPLASRLRELPEVAETGSVTRLGYWVLGRDHLASDEFVAAIDDLADWKPRRGKTPDWRDHDHLHAHLLQQRDVFLTWDLGLLELGERLAKRFGLRVMVPEDYLQQRGTGDP